MDLVSVGAALRRRWALLLVGLTLAVAGGAVTYVSAGSSYTSEAAVVLVPPPSTTNQAQNNPFLRLDYTVATTASILVRQVDSSPVRSQIADRVAGDFTVTNIALDPQTYTPTIDITSTAASATDATGTAQAVVDTITAQLTTLQANSSVSDDERISLEVAVSPTDAVASAAGKLRAGGSTFAGVLVLVLLATLALDGWLQSRRRRSTPAPVAAPTRPTAPVRAGAARTSSGVPAQGSSARTTREAEAGDELRPAAPARSSTTRATSAKAPAKRPAGSASAGRRPSTDS